MSNNGSGGPKTANGKKRSSRNARRHGLFAAQFLFSAADEAEYKKLTSDLREELRPNNSLLDLIFQDVVACAWRIRIALRYEQRELQKQFAIENEQSPDEPHGVGESFPYGLKARQREQVIKLLDYLRAEVKSRGVLPPDLEEAVTQACGANFWKALAEWTPLSPVRIIISRLTELAVEKSKMYGTKLPEAKVSPEEGKKYVASDGIKGQEMICKIIDIYKSQLSSALRPAERGGAMLLVDRLTRLDLAIRYQTTARRDFYRALREYREARNPG